MELPESAVLARSILALLLDLTLKGTLILAVAGGIAVLLRRAPASARHLVWSLAVCGVLLLPVLSAVLPAWHVAALTDIPYLEQINTALEAPATQAAEEAPVWAEVAGPAETVGTTGSAELAVPQAEPAAEAPLAIHQVILGGFVQLYEATRAAPWSVWLLGMWLLGVVFVLGRYLVGAGGVAWLAFRARPITDGRWRRLGDDVRHTLGLRRRVRLLRSVRTAMPMTWGLLRPVVLLPACAGEWPEERRRCVLLHEMAHIRRWDCLTQTLAQLACAVNWFNPLVWIAARQMRAEREVACDDYVLDGGLRPSVYATHLVAIARSTRTTRVLPLATLEMARPSQLEGRVLSILDERRRRAPLSRVTTALGFVLAGLVLLPLAAMHPAEAPDARLGTWQPTDRADTFHFADALERGQFVEIRGVEGQIQARPAAGPFLEIVAVLGEGLTTENLRVERCEDGLLVCLVDSANPGACAEVATGRTEAMFRVYVPEGVRLEAHVQTGDVHVSGLRSDVEVHTGKGDVYVAASGQVEAFAEHGDVELHLDNYGTATTRYGDIRAQIGRTNWNGTLGFHSEHGDVTVALPADADTDLDLRLATHGQLRSALALRDAADGHFRARVGSGGRTLELHSRRGDVTILHDGPAAPLVTAPPVAVAPAEALRPLHYIGRSGATLRYAVSRRDSDRLGFVHAMIREENDGAIDALGYVFAHDPDARVRHAVVVGLGEIGCEQALPHLFAALDDESARVREAAVGALAEIGGAETVGVLAHVVRTDESPRVRREAARALDGLEDGEAVAALAEIETLRDAFSRLDLGDLDLGGAFEIDLGDEDWHIEIGDFELDIDRRLFTQQNIETTLREVLAEGRFARSFERLGYENLSLEELLLARAAGVEAGFVRALQRAGLDAPMRDVARLKMAGVDAAFVREAARQASDDLTVERLLTLREAQASVAVPEASPEAAPARVAAPEPPQTADPLNW